jgi:hypothetical protein
MSAVIHKPISQLKITWSLLPDDFIVPDYPLENIDHPLIANGLRQSLVDSPELMQDALNGRYLIPGFDRFLGVWQGTREGSTGYWLRWWNAEGELLLWPEERAENERQRADREQQDKELAQTLLEQERQRNQELLARLTALGIEPE